MDETQQSSSAEGRKGTSESSSPVEQPEKKLDTNASQASKPSADVAQPFLAGSLMEVCGPWLHRPAKRQQEASSSLAPMVDDIGPSLAQLCTALNLLLSKLPLRDFLRLCSTSRALHAAACLLRGSPPLQLPWLMLPELSTPTQGQLCFYSSWEGRCYDINLPEIHGKQLHAVAHGWLLMRCDTSEELCLLNPISKARISLPSCALVTGCSFDAALSTSPTDPSCIFLLAAQNLAALWWPGAHHWAAVRSIKGYDPDSQACDLVSCGGKFYLLNKYRNLLVVELDGGMPTGKHTTFGPSFLPEVKEYRHGYLVESLGEVLLVLCNDRLECRAFRLDLENGAWVELDELGDRLLFLGRGCSVSVSATETGIRRSRIFLTLPQSNSSRDKKSSTEGRWFWAESDLAAEGRPALKYAPSHRAGDFSWGASHWVLPRL